MYHIEQHLCITEVLLLWHFQSHTAKTLLPSSSLLNLNYLMFVSTELSVSTVLPTITQPKCVTLIKFTLLEHNS